MAGTKERFEGHTHSQQLKKSYLLAPGDGAHLFDTLARSARPHVGH
jgi:hypothetical protein